MSNEEVYFSMFVKNYRGWDIYFEGERGLVTSNSRWTLVYSPLPQTVPSPQHLRGRAVWLPSSLSLHQVECCLDYIMNYPLPDNVRREIAPYLRHILAISAGS